MAKSSSSVTPLIPSVPRRTFLELAMPFGKQGGRSSQIGDAVVVTGTAYAGFIHGVQDEQLVQPRNVAGHFVGGNFSHTPPFLLSF